MSDIIYLILWVIVGIVALISSPTRYAYTIVWLSLLFEIGIKIFHDKTDNNNTPFAA